MAQDIATLLKKYAEFRELVRATQSLPDGDPAVSMLRQGFSECYDALNVTWIACEERMPDHDRPVWVCDRSEQMSRTGPIDFADGWDTDLGEWWIGDRTHICPEITHWAEIQWPAPPQKEGGGVCEA